MTEIAVTKVPVRPGRTDELVRWFRGIADRAELQDLLARQHITLRVFVEHGAHGDVLYSVKQGPDLAHADRVLAESDGEFIDERRRMLADLLDGPGTTTLTHVVDLVPGPAGPPS
jgi:hypothetical protein